MVRIYVPLKRAEYDRLIALADAERRPIRDQAALLVVRGLPARDNDETAATAVGEAVSD